jgi:Uma2 family endonuclease
MTMTAEELLDLSDRNGRVELVGGELRSLPFNSFEHGVAVFHIGGLLHDFVVKKQRGAVSVGVGFVLARDPDTVLAPDIAFLRSDRVPYENSAGFVEGPPDLAVEIISSFDEECDHADKARIWIAAGARAVWNVDLRSKSIDVYVANAPARARFEDDWVDGGNVLPGFACRVRDMFDLF